MYKRSLIGRFKSFIIQYESAFKMDEKMNLHLSKLSPGQSRAQRTSMALSGAAAILGLLGLAAPAMAIDFGPEGMFSLTGFGKVEVQRGSNHCTDCQLYPAENKQRLGR